MKAHTLLYWVLAWIQLRRADATSLAVKLWCNPPASWTSRHLDLTASQQSEASVDRLYLAYRRKVEDYCIKQCCRLGNSTCNVGVVKSGSESTQCLLYGSYIPGSCSFKRTHQVSRCDIASTQSQKSQVATATAAAAASTRNPSNTSGVNTTDATGTTVSASVTPPSVTTAAPMTAAHTTAHTAENLAENDASWQPVLKHVASGVKPRKGVEVPDAATTSRITSDPHRVTVPDAITAKPSTVDPETTLKHAVTSSAPTSTTPVPTETSTTSTTTTTQPSASPKILTTVPLSKPITQVPPVWETMLNPVSGSSNIEGTTVKPQRSSQKPQINSTDQSGGKTGPGKHASISSPARTSMAVSVDPEGSTPMGLIVGLSVGLMFIFVVMGLVGRQVLDLWQRRHYARMDFLVDGMYHVT